MIFSDSVKRLLFFARHMQFIYKRGRTLSRDFNELD